MKNNYLQLNTLRLYKMAGCNNSSDCAPCRTPIDWFYNGSVKFEGFGYFAAKIFSSLEEAFQFFTENTNFAQRVPGQVVTFALESNDNWVTYLYIGKDFTDEEYSNPENWTSSVSKVQLGLDKVDNTSDEDKPLSRAAREALDKKQDNLTEDQLKAVNSGITSEKLASIDSEIANRYTKGEIDNKLTGAFHYKGSVASKKKLPKDGNEQGDVYNVQDTGANYAWNGEDWDKLSETIDLTPYLKTEDAEAKYETKADASLLASKQELEEKVTPKADKAEVDTLLKGKVSIYNNQNNNISFIDNQLDGAIMKFIRGSDSRYSKIGLWNNDEDGAGLQLVLAKDNGGNGKDSEIIKLEGTKEGIFYAKHGGTCDAEEEITTKKDLQTLLDRITILEKEVNDLKELKDAQVQETIV